MALSPKDKETDRLAREVAVLTRETLTDAVRQALRERLEHGQPAELAARLREIGEHCASLPDYDTRGLGEIVSYDETGMWR